MVTCFETLEHLESFVPLVELLIELGARGYTVVLSVPNDAFWSIENPHHRTMWGEGAVRGAARLLPGDHVALEQVALAGSAIARARGGDARAAARRRRPGRRARASHFVAAPSARRPTRARARRRARRAGRAPARGAPLASASAASELAFMAARLQELESAR